MYIFAVALEDGTNYIKSYTKLEQKKKAQLEFGDQLKLMKIKNGLEKYHDPNPKKSI